MGDRLSTSLENSDRLEYSIWLTRSMPPRKVTKIALYDNNGCPNLSSSHDAGGRIAKNRNTATTIGWMIVESSLIAIITTNSKTVFFF